MNASRVKYYKVLFLIAAIYDLVLGIVFTFFYRFAFGLLGISDKLPEYGAYISLIGAFLFVIGVAYYLIYRSDLKGNRDLIMVGALYKFAYCATGLFYFVFGKIPHILFILLFGVIDLIMFVLMLECYVFLGKIDRDVVRPGGAR
jgi:hypothetical protein